jgi:PKD repeat protein
MRIPNRNEGVPANWVDTWNLWINITAYIQTATGFVRYVYKRVEPETPAYYAVLAALVVKTAIDIAGDIYSGVCTVVQPMKEMFDRPTINRHDDGAVRLADAYLWQPYASEIVSVSGGWPAYSWSSVGARDRPLALAAGLELVTPDYDADLGRTVQVVGTPTGYSASEGYFTLLLVDGYGPSSSDRAESLLVVRPAPAGIPTADFTTSPVTAQAPARIQFNDASTGSPTSWAWALDDGTGLITDKSPVADYSVADTYTITMVAINDKGHSEPVTRQLVVTAPDGTPVADFTFTDNPRSGAQTQFTSETSGGPTSYLWDFGDGRNSTERNPLITYQQGGDYVVSLVCANASGWGVRKRQLVSVHWA